MNSESAEKGSADGSLAMILFLAGEAMLFVTLIGAFLVFRFGAPHWPTDGQPRLSVLWPGVLTGLALLSVVSLSRGIGTLSVTQRQPSVTWLSVTLLFGAIFLAGLPGPLQTLSVFSEGNATGPYGFSIYAPTEVHRIHGLIGLAWLGVIVVRAFRNEPTPSLYYGTRIFQYYWRFVVGVWLVLYGLMYVV